MTSYTPDAGFDLTAWLRRIGYDGPCDPGLGTLRAIVAAHAAAIPFENIDPLLGRVPKLDVASLQRKIVEGGRGGYCCELNSLLRAGLEALGFRVTGLLARVVRGAAADAERQATHMMLRVDLPEGAYLADVGFGNQTPTAPLLLQPDREQATPHEPMRLIAVGDELTLQARLGGEWQNIYRLSLQPRLAVDFDVANWYTATHPDSPFVNNLIIAQPGPGGMRRTLFNSRLTERGADGAPERRLLAEAAEFGAALREAFGLAVTEAELHAALAALDHKGTRTAGHPFFV